MKYLYLLALLCTLNLKAAFLNLEKDLKNLSLEQLCNLDDGQLAQIEQLQISKEETEEIRTAWLAKGINLPLYKKISLNQERRLTNCVFSGDNAQVIAYNCEGDIDILNLSDGTVNSLENPKKDKIQVVRQHIIFYRYYQICIHNLLTNAKRQLFIPSDELIIEVRCDDKSNSILLLTQDSSSSKFVTIYDIESNTYSKLNSKLPQVDSILCYSKKYLFYSTNQQEKASVLFDLEKGKIVLAKPIQIVAAQFFGENQIIANASKATNVFIVTINDNETNATMQPIAYEYSYGIRKIVADKYGKSFIVFNYLGAYLHRFENLESPSELSEDACCSENASISPKGDHFVLFGRRIGDAKKTFRLFNSKVELNNCLMSNPCNTCSFSNDGHYFAAIKDDLWPRNVLYIWDLTMEDLSLTEIIKKLRKWEDRQNKALYNRLHSH